MREYFVMALSFFKILGKKIRHKGAFEAAYVQRLGPGVAFLTQRGAHILLGYNTCVSRNGTVFVGKSGSLTLGSRVYFNVNAYISCQNRVTIGDGCIFGPNVTVIDNNHTFSREKGVCTNVHNCGEIYIGENCWIGANAVILRNTKIGKNCVIGAGCVVRGVIPDGSIVTQDRTLRVREIQ